MNPQPGITGTGQRLQFRACAPFLPKPKTETVTPVQQRSLGIPAEAAGATRPGKANELALFAPALRQQSLDQLGAAFFFRKEMCAVLLTCSFKLYLSACA